MDAIHFDRLTRRFVVAGLPGGSLAALLGFFEVASKKKKKPSRRKRCRQKKREFCAGRCCPRSRQCLNTTCEVRCEAPLQCPFQGVLPQRCGPDERCHCTKTASGKNACVDFSGILFCNEVAECGPGSSCPAGQVCTTCGCVGSGSSAEPDFRCFPFCPDGG